MFAAPNASKVTCHSCKHKSNDIYALLAHVYVAHGLRVSEENLPNFAFNENQTKSEAHQLGSQRNQPVLTSTPTSTFGSKVGRLACKSFHYHYECLTISSVCLAKSLTPGRGNFNLDAFCSERLKECAERAGEPPIDPNNLLRSPSLLSEFIDFLIQHLIDYIFRQLMSNTDSTIQLINEQSSFVSQSSQCIATKTAATATAILTT
jgi:hypothetical protein